MDSFYLDGAVRLFEETVKELKNPAWGGRVVYGIDENGIGFEHCWGGDASVPVVMSRLMGNQRLHGEMIEQILSLAPKGADLSWRY
ncbi:hypothetical protein HDU76_012668 [Blyttiomyces sp. JEL0837]|nr:hypothetical protein HDU76_012668 [Blyttiomyces sp. JEL0837]